MRTKLLFLALAATLALTSCKKPAPATSAEPAGVPAASAAGATAQPAPTAVAAATGEACGGAATTACKTASDFCKKPIGQCNVPDAGGTCTEKPVMCTQQFEPVCGCDGKTYSNACAADSAGVNVASEGECPKPG